MTEQISLMQASFMLIDIEKKKNEALANGNTKLYAYWVGEWTRLSSASTEAMSNTLINFDMRPLPLNTQFGP